jgi:hypothetical protein
MSRQLIIIVPKWMGPVSSRMRQQLSIFYATVDMSTEVKRNPDIDPQICAPHREMRTPSFLQQYTVGFCYF